MTDDSKQTSYVYTCSSHICEDIIAIALNSFSLSFAFPDTGRTLFIIAASVSMENDVKRHVNSCCYMKTWVSRGPASRLSRFQGTAHAPVRKSLSDRKSPGFPSTRVLLVPVCQRQTSALPTFFLLIYPQLEMRYTCWICKYSVIHTYSHCQTSEKRLYH